MASSARYTRILVDEFDFSGVSNSLSVNGNVAVLDATGFQVFANEFIAGNGGGEIRQTGYYNGKGAGLMEQELQARLGSAATAYVAALFGTNTPACPAYVAAMGWDQQLTIGMPIANLITLEATWLAADGLGRGIRISTGAAAISATGPGTAYDLGAAGSDGGTAYLFVQAITGTATNATIDVESSATEGGVYASEGTWTLSAVGVQVVVMTGTVNRWLRINVTSLGGATSFVVVAIVSVNGVTQ